MDGADTRSIGALRSDSQVMRSNEETKAGEVEKRLVAHARGLGLVSSQSGALKAEKHWAGKGVVEDRMCSLWMMTRSTRPD